MADFSANSPFPLLDHNIIVDPNMEFTEINHQSPLFDHFDPHHFFNHPIPPNIFNQNSIVPLSLSNSTNNPEIQTETKKRKAIDVSETSSMNSSPQLSDCHRRKYNSRRGKKAKEEEEKPKEVVHVRARRGQATDSHSLAERVRRGKINERLKCLQDIVPGCYKTMGMAVMLDEIINYVQSLQNQVEFLSMKLTAASTFYDFNSEADAIETILRTKVEEGKEMERGSMSTYHHPPWSL